MYQYKIKEITKIYDGDTITAVIDLGFDITFEQNIRLYDINTPEIRGAEREQGLVSRDWLRTKLYSAIENNQTILLETIKDKTGKYGRYLGKIYIDSFDSISINEQLVQEGLAVIKHY